MIQITAGHNLIPLDQIAQNHWISINPKTAAGTYHHTQSLVARVTRLKNHYRELGDVKEHFYSALLKNNSKLLKKIVLAKPYELPRIIRRMTALLSRYGLFPLSKAFKDEINDEAFQYDNWRSNGKAGIMFQMLGIGICPYCNMGDVFRDNINGILVCDFDHYYDKASYPYLSLTFSNLIPTCKVCNETYKGTLPFGLTTHIHPHTDNYNQRAQFHSDFVEGAVNYDVTIIQNHPRTVAFSRDLGVAQRYNQHAGRQAARAAYFNAIKYNEYKSNLILVFNFTLEEAEKKICDELSIPYDESEILNISLGKLKRDLALKYNLLTTG